MVTWYVMSPVREEPTVTVRPYIVTRRANRVVANATRQRAGNRAIRVIEPIPRTMAMMASGIAAPGNGSSIVTGPSTIATPKWTMEATANAPVDTTISPQIAIEIGRHHARAVSWGAAIATSPGPAQGSPCAADGSADFAALAT